MDVVNNEEYPIINPYVKNIFAQFSFSMLGNLINY